MSGMSLSLDDSTDEIELPHSEPLGVEPIGMPKSMLVALTVSLTVHLAVLLVRIGGIHLQKPVELPDRLQVVYDRSATTAEASVPQRTVAQLPESPPRSSATATPTSQIRVPDRPPTGLPGLRPGSGTEGALSGRAPGGVGAGGLAAGRTVPQAEFGLGSTPSPVIDLTNLVAAAKGDPVLLSYFSVIREKIQRTANEKTWTSGNVPAQGIVYMSFVLQPNGQVRSEAVLSDRSVSSKPLQDIALSIIKSAGPFPPFPPSMAEPFKTVVVPLEFLAGS